MKNKKLIATIASLCLVVVAVVAAVVGVLAAANQTVTTTISVGYTANDVSAVVTLSKKAEGASDFTSPLPTGEGHIYTKTFEKTTAQTSANLELAAEVLSASVNYVIYKFDFQNTNTSYAMTVTPTYTAASGASAVADDNVTVNFAWTTPPTVNYTSEVASVSGGSAMNTLSPHNVPAGETHSLYIVVAITNLNADAQYYIGGANHNTLSFALARVGSGS